MTRPVPRTLALGLASLAALSMACISPSDRRPGLWLAGEAVADVPTDWSFSDRYREISVQVRTPYLFAHSVTIWCASVEGDLYIGARDPHTKSWPGWADRNPDVRLRVGAQLFDVRLVPVDDRTQIAELQTAYARKYALPGGSGLPHSTRYWRVAPRY